MTQYQKPYYDAEHDVIYVTFADKSNSYGEDISDSITVMRDYGTDSITGLIIYDYKSLKQTGALGALSALIGAENSGESPLVKAI
jgi:hypothetical protein